VEKIVGSFRFLSRDVLTILLTCKYKYKYNSYFYCAPYSLTDGALQKSAGICFIAVGRLK